jgi:hypothetical protein
MKGRLKLGGVALAALLAGGGCTVFNSIPFHSMPVGAIGSHQASCHSNAGSYVLPKALFSVKVWNDGATRFIVEGDVTDLKDQPTESKRKVGIVRVPDHRLGFCVELTEAGTSSDSIRLFKSDQKLQADKLGIDDKATSANPGKTGFLQAAFANTTDQSGTILRTLSRALLTIISGKTNYQPREAGERAASQPRLHGPYQFDPFDPRQSADANAALTSLGFCILMEDFTFGPSASVDSYCDNPKRFRQMPTVVSASYFSMQQRQPERPKHAGLLYRPRQTHTVAIYQKLDVRSPGRWRLVQSHPVEIENLSPVVSVGFSRSLFAGRRAMAIFDEGTLTGACVSKTSELAGFVEVPYEIVRGIVALPTNIIQLRIDETAQRSELLKVEERILTLQEQQLKLLRLAAEKNTGEGLTSKAPPAGTDPVSILNNAKLSVGLQVQRAVSVFEGLAKTICGTGKFEGSNG